MPVNVTAPFSWKSATGDQANMLKGLQPNILKAHTREFLTALFLKFNSAADARKFLKAIASGATPLVKSALKHLQEVDAFNTAVRNGVTNPPLGTSYVGVGITASGYDKLGIAKAKQPADGLFRGGMQADAALRDPPPSQWDAALRGPIDAIVMVGDSTPAARDAALNKVKALLQASPKVQLLGTQTGHSLHNKNGDGIEHFGYVDGRSQPLFLTEDLEHETLECDGSSNWDPGFAPSRAIVPDPASPNPAIHFGSYFIFRKLEQNVQLFKKSELKFAQALKLKGDDKERAGAMIVGRFEDGTPLTSQFAEGAHHPVQNNFNYFSDAKGGKCPFFAHIRKVNPRGSGGFEPQPAERLHIMARRGQTYGTRTDDPNDGKIFNKPKKNVGLLFMAFNADIGQQFSFTQGTWANNPGFPAAPNPPGLDMVIGQGTRPQAFCNVKWGEAFAPQVGVNAVPQCVTMKGGEYFFMPSLPFLQSL